MCANHFVKIYRNVLNEHVGTENIGYVCHDLRQKKTVLRQKLG